MADTPQERHPSQKDRLNRTAPRQRLESCPMSVHVSLPLTLRRFCDNLESVEITADTVGDAITALHHRFNGIRERLLDETGNIRGSVLIFVNQEDIRFLDQQRTPLKSGDQLSIIPAFAGG